MLRVHFVLATALGPIEQIPAEDVRKADWDRWLRRLKDRIGDDGIESANQTGSDIYLVLTAGAVRILSDEVCVG